MDVEAIARDAVDCDLSIHRELGPGLLESVYELLLVKALQKRGYRVERQRSISFEYDGISFDDAFRADIIVAGAFPIEVKSAEKASPIHGKQLLTYLRLMKLPLGLVMNFGLTTFKEGVQRVVNNHTPREAQ